MMPREILDQYGFVRVSIFFTIDMMSVSTPLM
jgi:hypothetical protein